MFVVCYQSHDFDFWGKAMISQRHTKLVFEVTEDTKSTDDGFRANGLAKRNGQSAVSGNGYLGYVLEGFSHKVQAFLRRKEEVFQWPIENGYHHLIKQAAGTHGDIDVPVMNRIESSREDGFYHGLADISFPDLPETLKSLG